MGGNVGNALQKVGSLFDQHKGSITSLLGLSDEKGGNPQALLTTILEGLKLDNSTMTSLSAVLKEQTGLDSTAITSTTNSIKEGLSNLGKGTGTSTKVGTLLVIFMAVVAI